MADITSIEKTALQLAKDTTAWIEKSVKENQITVPEGYDTPGEITTALMIIAQTIDKEGRPALESCSKESIMTQLRLMAQNGLSMARKQCYPIVRKPKLCIDTSYFGTISILKRIMPGYDVRANVIYKDDTYDYVFNEEIQCNQIVNVRSSIENRDKGIVGAYGVIFEKATGKVIYSEVMSWKEILTSWSHAKTDKVQKEFPQEMAKRTLIQRMCKLFLNTEKAKDIEGVRAYNEMVSNGYDDEKDITPSEETVKKQEAIRQKSKGNDGLKSILKKDEAVEVEAKPTESSQTNTAPSNLNAELKEVKLPNEEKKVEPKPVIEGIEDEEIPF